MLTRRHPDAEAPPGASAPQLAPSYLPSFLKRQATVTKVTQVAPGTVVDYDRGILAERAPGQVLVLKNSEFSPLGRGPIRNYNVRDWYWRAWWNWENDGSFPSAHVPVAFLPGVDGRIEGLPGGTTMRARSQLTFALSTPAWTTEPPTKDAVSNA